MTDLKTIPVQCPKSASPYVGCPLQFEHEDDAILAYLAGFVSDLKCSNISEDVALNVACQKITAYMNGRIAQILAMREDR